MRLEPGVFLGERLGGQALDGLTLTYYEYAGCSNLPFHEHECAYASFPVLGGYEEHCSREAHPCSAGRGVFHPPGEVHRDRINPAGATIFSLELDDRWLARIRDLGMPVDKRLELGTAVCSRARRLMRLLACGAAPLRLEAGTLDLLVELPMEKRERTTPDWILRVRRHLDECVTRPSLVSLAAIAGVHPVHLARTFRETQGVTVGDYFRGVRVARATELLGDPRRPLTDIAIECGFSDHSHLCREFKRATGVSPARFRSRR